MRGKYYWIKLEGGGEGGRCEEGEAVLCTFTPTSAAPPEEESPLLTAMNVLYYHQLTVCAINRSCFAVECGGTVQLEEEKEEEEEEGRECSQHQEGPTCTGLGCTGGGCIIISAALCQHTYRYR